MEKTVPKCPIHLATRQGKLRQRHIARRKSVLLFQGQGKLRQRHIARRKSVLLFQGQKIRVVLHRVLIKGR
ncbi:hypothetical protein [Virgibacillus proomii]|uniref:hypothetical protein n=1 Tax=Virgibacillus proomii TaxID=84407 RepID=UPI001C0FA89E|nr:hypothetical protein [Virgibacillus proomii]MBU5265701.1 hypothetical protein [Virgibacillus proomii]